MENDSIVFHGDLQQLLEKVETGVLIPKLQASQGFSATATAMSPLSTR